MSPSATEPGRIAVYYADMSTPEPKVLLTLPINASSAMLVVDEAAKHIYYAQGTASRPGQCGGYPGGLADNIVRASFDGNSEPVLVSEVANGYCVGASSAAHDQVGQKIYYSFVQQYVYAR
jgi:hypothetical protein